MNNTQALVRARVFVHTRVHSRVRDDLEDQVVEQRELLGYLQSGVVLERLRLAVLHGLIPTHGRKGRNFNN